MLDTKGKDGKTLRETCLAVEAQEGFTPAELLDAPDLPTGFEYLWSWFARLNSTRQAGFGLSAITETELRSFFLNRRIEPQEWEIQLILRLDRMALKASTKDT